MVLIRDFSNIEAAIVNTFCLVRDLVLGRVHALFRMEQKTGASFFSLLVTILQSNVLSSSLKIPLNVEFPKAPS